MDHISCLSWYYANLPYLADDHIIVSDSPVGLQNSLNVLGKCCSDWKLCVNMKTINIMIFSGKTVDKTLYRFYWYAK